MSNVTGFLRAGLLVCSVGVGLAHPALAQVGEAEPSNGQDIVVTAQKRVERLLDVPLAVTALSADVLSNRQINDTTGLIQAVPSLSFQQGNNPSNTSFRIRGIGTSLFNQGVEPSVSLVVDGVVAARQAQSFTDFADVERVEVLRGPQGTLFGKNATAGVISVTTARPSDKFQVRSSATVAEMNEYRVGGTVSGPLSQSLRARVTGYYNDVGGIVHNRYTGKNDNGSKSWGVRGKLDWDVTDRLNFLLAADYRKSDANCCSGVLVAAANPLRPQFAGPVRIGADSNEVWTNGLTFANSTQQTYSLQGDLDLDGATLTSITAYQHFRLVNNFEPDRWAYTTPIFIAPGASALYDFNQGLTEVKNFTQELRIASFGKRRLNYVSGLFYSHLRVGSDFARRRATCSTGTFGQPCPTPVYQSLSHRATLKSDNVAAFGQVEWEALDKLSLIGGLRLQYEKIWAGGQRFGPTQAGDVLFGPAATAWASRSTDDTALTGKAAVQYSFSRDAQAYLSFTRGYKGSGYDLSISADYARQDAVLPEHVNAYELGFKGRTSDGSLSLAAALFLADYTNLQVQANRTDLTTGFPLFIQTNAGSSQSKGFEIEATIRPSVNLSVNAAVTHTKAKIDVAGLGCASAAQVTAPLIPVGGIRPVNTCYRYQFLAPGGALSTAGPQQDVHGGQLPAAPRWRLSVSPRWEADLFTDHRAFIQTDVTLQSDSIFAVEQDPLLKQDGYALVDLSVGLRQADNRYNVTFFVKNLLDKNYYTSLTPGALQPTNLTQVDLYANRPKNADRYFGGTVSFAL